MLTPVETNYLIYRFLLESGYVHAAFMFGHESGIVSAGIADRSVPVGALLTLLEKGMQLIDIEIHMDTNGRLHICEQPLSLFQPHRCSIKSVLNRSLKPENGDTASNTGEGAQHAQQLENSAEVKGEDALRPVLSARKSISEKNQTAEESLASLAKNTRQHMGKSIMDFVLEQKEPLAVSGDLINVSPEVLELHPKKLNLNIREEHYIREVLKRIYSTSIGTGMVTGEPGERDYGAIDSSGLDKSALLDTQGIDSDIRIVPQNTFDSMLQTLQQPTDINVLKEYVEIPVKCQAVLDAISSQETGMRGSLVERSITLTEVGVLLIEVGDEHSKDKDRGRDKARSGKKGSNTDISFVSYNRLVSSANSSFLTSDMIATAATHAVMNNLVYMVIGFTDGLILVCTCDSLLNISATMASYPFGYLAIRKISFSPCKKYIAVIGDATRPFVLDMETYSSMNLEQPILNNSMDDLVKLCSEALAYVTREKDTDISGTFASWPLCTSRFQANFNENNVIRKPCTDLCWISSNSFVTLNDNHLIVISLLPEVGGIMLNGIHSCTSQAIIRIICIAEAKILAVVAENSIVYYNLVVTKQETHTILERVKLRQISDVMQFSGECFTKVFEYPKHIIVTTESGQVYGINKVSPTSLAWDAKLSGQPVCVQLTGIKDWFLVGMSNGGLIIISDSGHILSELSIFSGESCAAISGLTSIILHGSGSTLCLLSNVY